MKPVIPAKLVAEARTPITLSGVPQGMEALALAELARASGPLAYIISDGQRMADLEQNLAFFAPDIPVMTLPGWDCLPYDRVSPGADIHVQQINGADWRIYFLSDPVRDRVVAVGQLMEERTEVLIQLLGSYMVPWVLSLPITIAGIALALSRAFRPLRQLSADIKDRNASDLRAIPTQGVPADVAPLIDSMNNLFGRITNTLTQERRRTADASHELRSPIAALQAQWDAWNLARDESGKARASAQISNTISRLTRMVGQLLSLSAVEGDPVKHALEPIRWPVVIENALSDVLPLMERRHGDIEVVWPDKQEQALPLRGNSALLSMMIRNLLDNALRYGPEHNLITVRVTDTELTITDQGPGMPEMVLSRLGERFVRPAGQQASGSGIGLSIVMRIARMHNLSVAFEAAREATDQSASGTVVRFRPERT